MKDRILIADDVEELANTVGKILEHNNYDVDVVYNGEDAFIKTKQNEYDCIILDVMMPVMDGIETVINIRKININTPIILLTAKDTIEDKVKGLDEGANDYLTKPFDTKELLARIRALIRTKENEHKKYEIENIVFDSEKAKLERGKISFNLNNEECEILEILVNKNKEKVSKEELKRKICKNENSEDIIIPLCITYLQDKLRALSANVAINYNDGYYIEKIE